MPYFWRFVPRSISFEDIYCFFFEEILFHGIWGILFIRHVFSSNSLQFNTIIGDHYSAHLMLAIMFIRIWDFIWVHHLEPSGRHNTIAIIPQGPTRERNAFIAIFHYFVNFKNAFYCYFIHPLTSAILNSKITTAN